VKTEIAERETVGRAKEAATKAVCKTEEETPVLDAAEGVGQEVALVEEQEGKKKACADSKWCGSLEDFSVGFGSKWQLSLDTAGPSY
jgi:hypothetical protein